jgi:cation:H+ antiporter
VIGAALLAVAAVLLVAGAEMFVENAAASARRLGVTVLAVGVLLAGAEPEEMLTGVLASLRDRPDLAAGDAIGANLTMVTLALGLAALARPLPFGRRVRAYAVASAAAGVLAVLALLGGHVSRLEGCGLLAAYGAGVALVWWREKAPPAIGELAEAGDDDGAGRTPGLGLALAVAGLGVMLLGGAAAVEGATRIVVAAGLTDTAVGLTVLALATTAELFALVFAATRREVGELAVAGVVGSAAYNATASLGAAAVARPLQVTGMLVPALLAVVAPLALVALARRDVLGRAPGALLVVAYVAYIGYALGR